MRTTRAMDLQYLSHLTGMTVIYITSRSIYLAMHEDGRAWHGATREELLIRIQK
jgi:hypothetical protein